MKNPTFCLTGFVLLLMGQCLWPQSASAQATAFDIAPFARRCCVEDRHVAQVEFDYTEAQQAGENAEKAADGRYIYGLQWAEPRDIEEVRVRFKPGSVVEKGTVEYWSHTWPDPPPRMPSIEDPEDDAWQGRWLKAVAQVSSDGLDCRYTFQPLSESENPRAKNLPGLGYRRTLKLRLAFTSEPALEKVQVFSGSTQKAVQLRIELGAGESTRYEWSGDLRVYNGVLKGVRLWEGSGEDSAHSPHFHVVTEGTPKGLLVDLVAAEPSLPGSEDITIVTLNAGDRSFSFAVPDVRKAPVYVEVYHAYISLASDAPTFSRSIVKRGEKIREKLTKEPEQSYERALKEIPALNPAVREGDRLYLPLAADTSWQKFAVEWGGNIHISKQGTKAKGAELKRLEWKGDRITWRLGTGATPTYRPGWHDSKLITYENVVPVAMATWTTEGIHYTEEAFVTLLSGPLSPRDPDRNEETPAILMVKVTAQNPASAPAVAHVWLATNPDEEVSYDHGDLAAGGGQLVRAHLKPPDSAQAKLAQVPDSGKNFHGMQVEVPLAAGGEQSLFLSLPFVPRLTEAERSRLAALDYDAERQRVVSYWREILAHALPFTVPDEHFMELATATVPHEFISVTKDPSSGLWLVPAASYDYDVFANVGALQCITFDYLGFHQLAADGLHTFVYLQGNRPMIGTYAGDQKAVYNGARIDPDDDHTSGEYNLNHGAALWGLAEHYFLSRDKEWLRSVAPSMMRAADWVVEQRKLTEVLDGGEKIPEYGLLPAGNLEDNTDWGHWFGVNAEASNGMTRLAEALADIGAPEAAHYAEEAAAYKSDIRDAVFRAARIAPVVRLRDNTYVPYIPSRVYIRIRHFGPNRKAYYSRYPTKVLPCYRASATSEVFAGPVLLLLRNVFQPGEPVADWILDDWEDNATMSSSGLNVHGMVDEKYWFSQGGMVFEALRNPAPVYLKANEVPAAIRSVYNNFVATYYPDPNEFTEEYHQWVHGAGPFYKTADEARFVNRLRNMLVREDGDALWLAAGVPRRWLSPGKKIELNNAPTYFGPASYKIEANDSEVEVHVQLPTRNEVRTVWLVLRYPGEKPIQSVEIDGKAWQDFDAPGQRIHLPITGNPMQISAHF